MSEQSPRTTVIVEDISCVTYEHLRNLPYSQVLKSEDGEFFLFLELWGMHRNFVLVQLTKGDVDKWKATSVSEQADFFNSHGIKLWENFGGSGWERVKQFEGRVAQYLNSRRLTAD